jgi:tetratricopeptide (TPR) repeat protein
MHCAFHYNSRPRAHSARMKQCRFLSLKKLGFFCLLLALSLSTLRAVEGDSPAAVTAQPDAAIGSNDIARAYFQLQDQVVATQFAVERARQEFQAAAARDALTVSNRLQAIQESLLLQHAELAEAHHLNRLLLVVMGVFAVVIFATAGLTVYFQSRAMNRLADISAELSASRGMALALPPAASVGLRDHKALSNGAVEQSSARLIGLVQVLEKRIGELEQTAGVPVKQGQKPITNGHTQEHAELTLGNSKDLITPKDVAARPDVTAPKDVVASTTPPADSAVSKEVPAPKDPAAPKDIVAASADLPVWTDLAALKEVVVSKDLTVPKDTDAKDIVTEPKDATAPKKLTSPQEVTANWMERAQSFLDADRPENALAYCDAILVTAPTNAEALLKKGMALEKMSRPQEALEYYDRAIAANHKLTVAHLQKGGLCNRLEKYGEAIESYEQALHTREQKQAV